MQVSCENLHVLQLIEWTKEMIKDGIWRTETGAREFE